MIPDESRHSVQTSPPSSDSRACSPQTPQRKNRSQSIKQSIVLVESPYFSPSKSRSRILSQAPKANDGFPNPCLGHGSTRSADDSVLLLDRGASSHESGDVFIEQPLDLSGLLERLSKVKPLLIQEKVADNPWKLLISVTLLNKTAGKLAIPVFWQIIEKWPTPLELAHANPQDLVTMIHHLGTQTIRSKRLIDLSRLYLQEPPSIYDLRVSRVSASPQKRSRFFPSSSRMYPATPISHLPGTGTYALDSYRIFSTCHENPDSDEWKLVMPFDKELIRFLRWKWAYVEKMEWSPTKGAIRPITAKYLSSLIDDLENVTL